MKLARPDSSILLVLSMIVVAVIARLLPHPPNFTPLAALALFAGAVSMRPAMMVGVICAAMLISDAAIGFHALMPIVYVCLLANLWIGARMVRGSGQQPLNFSVSTLGKLAGGSLVGSCLFFLVTNFAHWMAFYPPTWSGLTSCYAAAVPFFQYTLAGDLTYCGVLFGSYALITARSRSGSMSPTTTTAYRELA